MILRFYNHLGTFDILDVCAFPQTLQLCKTYLKDDYIKVHVVPVIKTPIPIHFGL